MSIHREQFANNLFERREKKQIEHNPMCNVSINEKVYKSNEPSENQ